METITTKQLSELLQVGEATAQKLMQGIKGVSDTMGVSGICHRQDYELWLETRKGKTHQWGKSKNK